MPTMLSTGSTVRLETYGMSCTVEQLLGAGGQGEVYLVTTAGSGPDQYALKWYYPGWATREQLEALHALIRLDSPSPRFLWPIDVAMGGPGGFGYVMELRPPQFHGIVELMLANISPTFRALTTAAFQFADGFLQLHASGLCYRDISFGNAFINADTGDVLICDNDNVGIDGRAPVGVRGTDMFMAPEVARGEALPSTATDLYSLSVLIFHLFMVHHPLVGGRELEGNLTDQDADHRMYAEDPLFIWDPVDESNRPVPGVHQNAIVYWEIYPTFLRQLFTQAFTSGLTDPLHGRVREGEWRAAALRLRDAIYYCGACGQENFWDADASPGFCWSCRRQLEPPPRLVSSRYVVLLNDDTKLFAHHLAGTSGDFSRELATVVRHPSQGVWGLRNLSGRAWQATTAGGSSFTVEPGRSCTLADGSQLDFGQIQATIRT